MGITSKVRSFIESIVFIFKKREMIPITKVVNESQVLENKVALITGGTSGIGFSVAQAFVSCGAKVILAARNEEKLKECCTKLGSNAKWIVLDVTEVEDIESRIKTASMLFEDGKIDILVNSAGIGNKLSFLDMTLKEYDVIMDSNVKGTYFVSQAIAKLMIEKGVKGHILNVSSASALRPAWSPYQISKWAVRGMTLGLADELLKYGIVVNAIAPGPVATPMLGMSENDSIFHPTNPAGRYAVASEIADLAVFMVSDRGNLIVGDTFYITGGGGTISYHN